MQPTCMVMHRAAGGLARLGADPLAARPLARPDCWRWRPAEARSSPACLQRDAHGAS